MNDQTMPVLGRSANTVCGRYHLLVPTWLKIGVQVGRRRVGRPGTGTGRFGAAFGRVWPRYSV
jgi:hypothetical protein